MHGFIAFFDILGYRNFLRNNSATESAKEVLGVISEIDKRVYKQCTPAKLNADDQRAFDSMRKSTDWLTFSDTIVLTTAVEENLTPSERVFRAMYFLMHSASVVSAMFLNGLPVRGALHYGSYVFEKTCIAGTGIVDSYDMCSGLDLATAIVSDECMNEFRAAVKAGKIWEAVLSLLVTPYLIPTKIGEVKGHVLDWWGIVAQAAEKDASPSTIDQIVWSAFWKHGKDISETAESKVSNTLKLVRYLVIRKEKREQSITTKEKK